MRPVSVKIPMIYGDIDVNFGQIVLYDSVQLFKVVKCCLKLIIWRDKLVHLTLTYLCKWSHLGTSLSQVGFYPGYSYLVTPRVEYWPKELYPAQVEPLRCPTKSGRFLPFPQRLDKDEHMKRPS